MSCVLTLSFPYFLDWVSVIFMPIFSLQRIDHGMIDGYRLKVNESSLCSPQENSACFRKISSFFPPITTHTLHLLMRGWYLNIYYLPSVSHSLLGRKKANRDSKDSRTTPPLPQNLQMLRAKSRDSSLQADLGESG